MFPSVHLFFGFPLREKDCNILSLIVLINQGNWTLDKTTLGRGIPQFLGTPS